MAYRKTAVRLSHSEKIRQTLLVAARALIENEGPDNLTIRKIVQKADTSTGNYYFYFKNKEEVLGILIDEELALISDKINMARKTAAAHSNKISAVLASMVYTGVRIGLESKKSKSLVFHQNIRKMVYPKLEKLMIGRTKDFFEKAKNLKKGLSPELAAVLWQGSLLLIIERGGIAGADAAETASFCVSWNLRAIGTSETETNEALITAQNVWNELK